VRRKYDKEQLLAHPTIRAWYDGHKSSSKNWRDIPRFMAWRERMGYSADPDEWIAECLKETNETLTRHATIIKNWVESSEFAGDKHSARERYAASMSGFYLTHMIRLPPIKISASLSDNAEVEVQTTASKHLEMVKIVLTCGKVSLRTKALMMCQTQGGIDASTFTDVFNLQAFPQLARHFGTERFRGLGSEEGARPRRPRPAEDGRQALHIPAPRRRPTAEAAPG
jgi:hypothetical protein